MENNIIYEAAKLYLENGNISITEMKLLFQVEEDKCYLLDDFNSIEAKFSEKINLLDTHRKKITIIEYFFEINIKYDELKERIDKKLVINIVKFEFTNQLLKLVQDYQFRRKIESEIYIQYKWHNKFGLK